MIGRAFLSVDRWLADHLPAFVGRFPACHRQVHAAAAAGWCPRWSEPPTPERGEEGEESQSLGLVVGAGPDGCARTITTGAPQDQHGTREEEGEHRKLVLEGQPLEAKQEEEPRHEQQDPGTEPAGALPSSIA
jgi:hypothetical protein